MSKEKTETATEENVVSMPVNDAKPTEAPAAPAPELTKAEQDVLDSIPDVHLKADHALAILNALSIAHNRKAFTEEEDEAVAAMFNGLIACVPTDYLDEQMEKNKQATEAAAEQPDIVVPDKTIVGLDGKPAKS